MRYFGICSLLCTVISGLRYQRIEPYQLDHFRCGLVFVARDGDGEIYTVRYEAVNAMLLNEFLKEHQRAVEEHRKVEEQGAMIAKQQKQIEALTATVQKVSDQIALNKPAPQLVANP